MESQIENKQVQNETNINQNNSQSPETNTNSIEQLPSHRHSTLDKAILSFQLENVIIKLPRFTSFIVDLQIDDSKLIFSPKATQEENNFSIGYHTEKIVAARINNSHTRAKARKIHISVSVFSKEKRRIGSGQIDINPGSFYGEEKLKLRPISLDLGMLEPCPLFFFGLQLTDIPTVTTDNAENSQTLPTLRIFDNPDTLVATGKRTARRNSDAELMTDAEREKFEQEGEVKCSEREVEHESESDVTDEEFFVINNPELIEMIEEEKRKEEEEKRRKEEEERRRVEEERRKEEEERKRIEEEEKRRAQEEVRKKAEEEKRRREEDERRRREEAKRRSIVDLMQRVPLKKWIKNGLRDKRRLVNSLERNSAVMKDVVKSLAATKTTAATKRSFSASPKKVTAPPLLFPLRVAFNCAFGYAYDARDGEDEGAPLDTARVALDRLDVGARGARSAFRGIGAKAKSTDEVANRRREEEALRSLRGAVEAFAGKREDGEGDARGMFVRAIGNSPRGRAISERDLARIIAQARQRRSEERRGEGRLAGHSRRPRHAQQREDASQAGTTDRSSEGSSSHKNNASLADGATFDNNASLGERKSGATHKGSASLDDGTAAPNRNSEGSSSHKDRTSLEAGTVGRRSSEGSSSHKNNASLADGATFDNNASLGERKSGAARKGSASPDGSSFADGLTCKDHITSPNNRIDYRKSDSGGVGPTFLGDSFVAASYTSYGGGEARAALRLLRGGGSGTSSAVESSDFAIDEICAVQGDVDNDELGRFRTRYASLERQAKIRFILTKMRRYNQQNRPKALETENLLFYEWKGSASSDEDELYYEYYDYE